MNAPNKDGEGFNFPGALVLIIMAIFYGLLLFFKKILKFSLKIIDVLFYLIIGFPFRTLF